MATTFNNWESLASIRAKLNANAGEINWKANLSGGNTFSGDQAINGRIGIDRTPNNNLSIWSDVWAFNWIWIWKTDWNIDIRMGQSLTRNVILWWKYNAVENNAYAILETYGWSNPLYMQSGGWDLIVNWQNWTSAWTSYTPSALMVSWSGASFTVYSAKYKIIWKLLYINLDIWVSSVWTASGDFWIINPFSAIYTTISWWIYRGSSQIWLFPEASWTTIKVVKTVFTSVLQWSDINNWDFVYISWCIEIA